MSTNEDQEVTASPRLATDVIWDQLARSMQGSGESQTRVDELMDWWNDNLAVVFPRPEEAQVARRVLKVLALASPYPPARWITAREMTRILRVSVAEEATTLDDRAVADILERMAGSGSTIARLRSMAGDAMEDRFLLRRDAPQSIRLETRIREVAATLADRPAEVARAALLAADSPALPLASLAAIPRTRRSIRWQGTPREGWIAVDDPSSFSSEELRERARELATGETDFLLYLVPPLVAPAAAPPSPVPAGPEIALLPIVIWTPRPLPEPEFVAVARARQILAQALAAEGGSRARELADALAPELENDRKRLAEMTTRAYAEGHVQGPAGASGLAEGAGEDPFDLWLEHAAGAVLEQRYPRHFMVSPRGTTLTRGQLAELVEAFLRPGRAGPGGHLPQAVRPLVEGYLNALGLVTGCRRGWHLDVDLGRSDVAREILEAAGNEPTSVEELYWKLRKGPLGLSRACFEVLLAVLLFSGHLVGLARSRRLPLARVTVASLGRVAQVVREKPVSPEVAEALVRLRFLFIRRSKPAAWPLLPQQLWDEIIALRSSSVLGLGALIASVRSLESEPLLSHLGLEETMAWLDALFRALQQVDLWSAPREGLRKLHRSLADAGLLARAEHARQRLVFVRESAARFVGIAGYLAQEDLDVGLDERHGPLAIKLAELRDRVVRPETCLDPNALVAFEREVRTFQEAYRNAYALDHDARRAPAALESYGRLASSARWKLVEALLKSSFVSPPATYSRLRGELDRAARTVCTRLTPSRLEVHATCVCGHRLGETPPLLQVADLTRWRDEMLREVVRGMARDEVRQELTQARDQARVRGERGDAAVLGELAALSDEAPDLDDRVERLTGMTLVPTLSRVVTARVDSVRDLGALAVSLVGRTLPSDQVVATVTDWLETPIAVPGLVRIVDSRARGRYVGPEALLLGSSAARTVAERCGIDPALSQALMAHWAVRHEVPPLAAVRAAGLAVVPGADLAALAEDGARILEHGPDAAVDDLAARTALDARQPELLELIGGTGGTAAVARALTREVVFPRLARRLAVTLLRAVSAGARLRWPASPASSPGQPRCRSSVAAYHDLVRSASELASRVGELADLRGGRPCTPVGWEERFDRLEPLPLLESRLEESASRLSLAVELDSTGLRKSLTELLAVEAEAFATTYRELVPTVWQEGDMPLWPHRVLVPLLSHHRRTSTPQTTVLVVVDAMRRDLFRLVRAGLHSTSGSDLLQLEERTIWALAPTLTGLNMRALTERIVPGVGDLLGEEFPDEAACDRSHALPYAPDGVQLETIPEIDEHVHGSTLSLARLADAVVPAVVARLASIIDRARPGTLIAVAADHGFAEVAGWRPHASSRRWRHGGLDPFEVLVPLGVYQKAWSRSGE